MIFIFVAFALSFAIAGKAACLPACHTNDLVKDLTRTVVATPLSSSCVVTWPASSLDCADVAAAAYDVVRVLAPPQVCDCQMISDQLVLRWPLPCALSSNRVVLATWDSVSEAGCVVPKSTTGQVPRSVSDRFTDTYDTPSGPIIGLWWDVPYAPIRKDITSTPTLSLTHSKTPTNSPTRPSTASPTSTPSRTPTASSTFTLTPMVTATRTPTPPPTFTRPPTASPSLTPTPTPDPLPVPIFNPAVYVGVPQSSSTDWIGAPGAMNRPLPPSPAFVHGDLNPPPRALAPSYAAQQMGVQSIVARTMCTQRAVDEPSVCDRLNSLPTASFRFTLRCRAAPCIAADGVYARRRQKVNLSITEQGTFDAECSDFETNESRYDCCKEVLQAVVCSQAQILECRCAGSGIQCPPCYANMRHSSQSNYAALSWLSFLLAIPCLVLTVVAICACARVPERRRRAAAATAATSAYTLDEEFERRGGATCESSDSDEEEDEDGAHTYESREASSRPRSSPRRRRGRRSPQGPSHHMRAQGTGVSPSARADSDSDYGGHAIIPDVGFDDEGAGVPPMMVQDDNGAGLPSVHPTGVVNITDDDPFADGSPLSPQQRRMMYRSSASPPRA